MKEELGTLNLTVHESKSSESQNIQVEIDTIIGSSLDEGYSHSVLMKIKRSLG